jgi:rare lipoprotein A (peptidoglycan hydrolase)
MILKTLIIAVIMSAQVVTPTQPAETANKTAVTSAPVAKQVQPKAKPKTNTRAKESTSRSIAGKRFRTSQATCYSVSQNGRRTANGEHNFSDGPELLCALPTNLNPKGIYCKHKAGICKPIFVVNKRTKELVKVHVIDHCPHKNVIDFNHAAANKIFLNKNSSKKDWWSRGTVQWFR